MSSFCEKCGRPIADEVEFKAKRVDGDIKLFHNECVVPTRRVDALRDEVTALRNELHSLRRFYEARGEEVAKLNQTIKGRDEEIDRKDKSCEALHNRISVLLGERAELRKRVDELSTKVPEALWPNEQAKCTLKPEDVQGINIVDRPRIIRTERQERDYALEKLMDANHRCTELEKRFREEHEGRDRALRRANEADKLLLQANVERDEALRKLVIEKKSHEVAVDIAENVCAGNTKLQRELEKAKDLAKYWETQCHQEINRADEQRAQHNAELDKISGGLNEWRLKAEKLMADADEWRQKYMTEMQHVEYERLNANYWHRRYYDAFIAGRENCPSQGTSSKTG